MAKSETAQWAGLRFLYLAITGVVWICGGEIAFFVATLAMRRFLAGIDRPPELAEIEATARAFWARQWALFPTSDNNAGSSGGASGGVSA